MRGLLGTMVDFVRAARGTVAVRLSRAAPRRWLAVGACAGAVLLVGAATVWLINSVETTSYAGAESDRSDRAGSLRLDALSQDTEPEGSDAGTEGDRDPDRSGNLPPDTEEEAAGDGASDSVPVGDAEVLQSPDSRDTPIDGSAEATGGRRRTPTPGSSGQEDTDPSDPSGSDDRNADGSTSPTTDGPPPTDGSGGSDGDSSGLLDGLVGGLLGGVTGLLTPG